jgi:hypothetical protein
MWHRTVIEFAIQNNLLAPLFAALGQYAGDACIVS